MNSFLLLVTAMLVYRLKLLKIETDCVCPVKIKFHTESGQLEQTSSEK
jgi:hypothetical protein